MSPAAPLDTLRELARAEAELVRLRRDRIASARAAGATWEQVGAALGMTRQAARELFTRDARTAITDNTDAHEPPLGENEALELASRRGAGRPAPAHRELSTPA